MRTHVIGIASPKQGGKDMVKDILIDEIDKTTPSFSPHSTTEVIRFADPLKDLVCNLFGWDREKIDNDVHYKETPDSKWNELSPRKALQLIGTEMFREGPLRDQYGITIWVQHFCNRIEDISHWALHLTAVPNSETLYVICPDVRFRDEMYAIKYRLNGTLIWVHPVPRIVEDPDAHKSERQMWNYDGYDYFIDSGHEMQKTIDEAKGVAGEILENTSTFVGEVGSIPPLAGDTDGDPSCMGSDMVGD